MWWQIKAIKLAASHHKVLELLMVHHEPTYGLVVLPTIVFYIVLSPQIGLLIISLSFTGVDPCLSHPCANKTSCFHNGTNYLCLPNDEVEKTTIHGEICIFSNSFPSNSSSNRCLFNSSFLASSPEVSLKALKAMEFRLAQSQS